MEITVWRVVNMGGKKTRGRYNVPLSNIVSLANETNGITVRHGNNHDYVLNYSGMRPCPIDTSTDFERMVVRWFRQVTGYDKQTIFEACKAGYWPDYATP